MPQVPKADMAEDGDSDYSEDGDSDYSGESDEEPRSPQAGDRLIISSQSPSPHKGQEVVATEVGDSAVN